MNSIKLIYCNIDNYGDCMSPYVIGKLSGLPILRKDVFDGKLGFPKKILSLIFKCKWKEIKHVHLPYERTVVAIGSILSMSTDRSDVWGSGFISENQNFWGGRIYAVRGKYSRDKLLRMGHECPEIYGDPALLLPIIYPLDLKKNGITLIPHYVDYDEINKKFSSRYKVLDLRTDDIEKITREIASSAYVISSSLHGVVVAHAYGIPAIWFQNNKTDTDGLKFNDYFSSVNIPLYDGFLDWDNILNDFECVTNFFDRNKQISLPQIELKEIQSKLIKSAPFPILDSIKRKFY